MLNYSSITLGLPLGGSVTSWKKGGDAMKHVTYTELFQFCLVIIGVITLCVIIQK